MSNFIFEPVPSHTPYVPCAPPRIQLPNDGPCVLPGGAGGYAYGPPAPPAADCAFYEKADGVGCKVDPVVVGGVVVALLFLSLVMIK